MVKAKSKAIIGVADGADGIMTMVDHRFDKGDWPICFEIPTDQEQADRWLRYLGAESHRRGWTTTGVGQLERDENSGALIITALGKPLLDLVWEPRCSRAIKVRARPALSSEFRLPEAKQFFTEVNEAYRSGATEPIYARGTLAYQGLAWRGELWLDNQVRLAPPSLQYETAVWGPRIVHVDAVLDCIGTPDVPYALNQLLQELAAFLSVVTRAAVRVPEQGRTWTWKFGVNGCEVRNLGYIEASNPVTMPIRGTDEPVPLYAPDTLPFGIDANEISLRADVADLWKQYRSLTDDQRRQFFQAAAKWQEAMIHWQERPTLSFALMVVACEALKPVDADDRFNGLHVIEALVGKQTADTLRQNAFPAQRVRSTHLHTGELHGSELILMAFTSIYQDPGFGDAHRELARVTPAALIEWLKRRGTFVMPRIEKKKTVRRWIKDYAMSLLK